VDAQIAAARDRVLDDFAWPDRPADEVNAAFDLELRRFENARIQSFVSILVERAVRAAFTDDGVPRLA
jgi:hypothetical protein